MAIAIAIVVRKSALRENETSKKSHQIHACVFCYLSISFASASRTSIANDVSLTPTTPGEAHRTQALLPPPAKTKTTKNAKSVGVFFVLIIFLFVASFLLSRTIGNCFLFRVKNVTPISTVMKCQGLLMFVFFCVECRTNDENDKNEIKTQVIDDER